MWIGLLLVAFNLVRKWPEISSVIFSGAASLPTDPGQPASGGDGRHSIQVPIDPFLPTGPKITIPLPILEGLVMPPAKVKKQTGYDVVVTTAFELIGVGLMALLAGVSDQMGSVVVIVMAGFMIGWLIMNSGTLEKWVKNL